MLILHAGLIERQFIVWGETPADATQPVRRSVRPKRQAASAKPSPWNADADQLRSTLKFLLEVTEGTGLSSLHAENFLVWLPTVENAPVPSSPLLAPLPESDTPCTLTPWQVTGVTLSWDQAVSLLCACIGRDTLDTGILIGNTLCYWATAMRFAGALVARQQYLPDLEKADEGYRAIWRPLLAGPEAESLTKLAWAMPAACRALSKEATTPPETPSARALTDFLADACDHLARATAAATETRFPIFTPRARKPKTASFDSLHDQWLYALRASNGQMEGDAKELGDFAAQVREWRRPLFLSLAAPFRFCFRLEEPVLESDEEDIEDAAWYVRFLLQSVEDPSLFIPVEKAWSKKGAITSLLRRDDFQPREFLLTALGQATKICPQIETSLKSAAPEGYALTTAGAQDFLMEKAWMLEQSGFVVQFPAWWTRKGTKQRLTASASVKAPKMQSLTGITMESLVQFRWEVALGGVQLTLEELEALARQKVSLVRVRGQWVQLDTREIEAALAFWKRKGEEQVTLRQVMRMALGAESAPGGMPIEGVQASGWVADLLAQMSGSASLEPLPAPEGFHGTLRPYQQRGYEWLHFLGKWGLGACLADDMGLGKAQPLDANILTPTGWKQMSDIQVGEVILNSEGGRSQVIGVFPQGVKDIYRVEFTDGSVAECCDEHLWAVNTPVRKRRGNVFRPLPLCHIRSTLKDAAGNLRHYVPMVQPVEFAEEASALSVDPYLLGVLLGDGGLSGHSVHFTTADAELIDRILPLLPQRVTAKQRRGNKGYDWALTCERSGGENKLLSALRALGLMGKHSEEKFVPAPYKWASSSIRLAVLQGLLDTDGCVRQEDNNIEFCSTSRQLAEDVSFLVQSLGGTARVRSKLVIWNYAHVRKERICYRMSVCLPPGIVPFRLTRKAGIYRPRVKYLPTRGIKSVTYVGKKQAQCIAVDAPDHLYITDNFLLTHNTAQTLAFLRRHWEENDRRPALVICPTSVVGNWVREAQRFTPDLPVMVHHGLTRTRGDAFGDEAEKHAIVLSSFALLHRDFEILKEVEWGGVILDEAQNIKNPETKQSKAARGLKADWRIALSGTPVENHVGDLWAILEFLNPGFLGNQSEFKRNFYLPIQASHDPDAAERLKRLTRPFILRRLKTDKSIIADLPEKLEMKTYCTLTPEQASLYEAVVKEMTEELDESEGIQRRGMILATLSKLKQVCNHPAQFLGDNSAIPGRSGKLARLTEMLEEALSTGDKALIFTQFTEMGEIIRKHLQETFGKEALFLHGGVPKKQRDRMVERFQSEGAPLPFFLLSLKAGGVGLNLTAANHVFHFDRWWNPAVENQATDRAFRIGQKKNVQVHKFLCVGTLEEKIDEMIENKRQVAANVVGTGEEWLTELSTAELKELFALRKDALAGT